MKFPIHKITKFLSTSFWRGKSTFYVELECGHRLYRKEVGSGSKAKRPTKAACKQCPAKE